MRMFRRVQSQEGAGVSGQNRNVMYGIAFCLIVWLIWLSSMRPEVMHFLKPPVSPHVYGNWFAAVQLERPKASCAVGADR